MRVATLISCLILLPILAGCSIPNALVEVFGDYYTGGGHTQVEKRLDHSERMEPSPHYKPWNP